jgi:membrane-bound lytic murein transglycosylase A
MQRNQSFIFFEADQSIPENIGPIGAAGVNLQALRSLAIDRSIWPYGLPFWIDAEIPWRSARPEAFQRLMIAQDTGSAIVGPARGDIFFGTGDEAGILAGGIRHVGRFAVLLPK